MAFWIALLLVSLFVLGSLVTLKPNARERRIDELRMQARHLGFVPKLVAYPQWLKQTQPSSTAYHSGRLLAAYRLKDEPTIAALTAMTTKHLTATQLQQRVALPERMQPFIKGMSLTPAEVTESDSADRVGDRAGWSLYWDEVGYFNTLIDAHQGDKATQDALITADLTQLYQQIVRMLSQTGEA